MKKIKILLSVVFVSSLAVSSVVIAADWTAPTLTFPQGSPAAPINESSELNTKLGPLKLDQYLNLSSAWSNSIMLGPNRIFGGPNYLGLNETGGKSLLFNSTGVFDINTKGIILPRPTTAPTVSGQDAGTIYYDSTNKSVQLYDGTIWKEIGAGTGSSVSSQWTTATNGNDIYYSTGNVGIGAAGPSQALDVTGRTTIHPSGTGADNAYNGNLVITKPAASGQYINLIRSGSYPWSIGTIYNSNTFAIGTGLANDSSFTSPSFVMTTEGKVGIGDTNPRGLLQVSGNPLTGGDVGTILEVSDKTANGTNSTYGGIMLTSRPGYDFSIGKKTVNNDTYFQIRRQDGPELVTVDVSGKVGIGVTNPRAQLELADIYDDATSKNLLIGDDTFLKDIDQANTLGIYGNQDSTKGSIKLGSGGGIISGYNDNIGIGTTNPQTPLSVLGSLTLMRQPGSSVTAGAGPSLILESPSNLGISAQLDPNPPVPCGGSGQESCGTDNTPVADSSNMYICPPGSGGQYYSNDVGTLGGSVQKYHAAVTCAAGTGSFSLQTNNGVLQFLNNGGTSKVALDQEGDLGINATPDTNVKLSVGSNYTADWKYGILSGVSGTNATNTKAIAVNKDGVDTFAVYGDGRIAKGIIKSAFWNGADWLPNGWTKSCKVDINDPNGNSVFGRLSVEDGNLYAAFLVGPHGGDISSATQQGKWKWGGTAVDLITCTNYGCGLGHSAFRASASIGLPNWTAASFLTSSLVDLRVTGSMGFLNVRTCDISAGL